MPRDYYDVLGVGRDADTEAIKRAYRWRARELHPDVSLDPDAEGRFREVSEAYTVLVDEEARRLYDRLGWRGRGRPWTPRRGAARTYAANPRTFLEDAEAILAAALGRTPGRAGSASVVAEVEVDAYEAYLGTTRSVTVPQPHPCRACDGNGTHTAVSDLRGARFVAVDECPTCRGTGEVATPLPTSVVVPPRVRDDDRIPVGPDAVAVVRVVPPRDALGIRFVAFVALLAAVGFLLYLLAL